MFVLTRFEMQNTIRWRRPVVSKQSSNVTSEPRSLQCEQEQAGSAQPCGLQNIYASKVFALLPLPGCSGGLAAGALPEGCRARGENEQRLTDSVVSTFNEVGRPPDLVRVLTLSIKGVHRTILPN